MWSFVLPLLPHELTHLHIILPTPYSFTNWLACHTDYQVVRQGQSIHPHEDEREREGGGWEREGRMNRVNFSVIRGKKRVYMYIESMV